MANRISPIERLMARVVRSAGPLETECWVSTYCAQVGGYTHIKINGVHLGAHRFAYEHFVGPIPAGLVIDHLCCIPACVNPAHLEAVTQRVNFLRGTAPAAENVRTGMCKWGHPLDGRRPDGTRRCTTCGTIRQRRYRASAS